MIKSIECVTTIDELKAYLKPVYLALKSEGSWVDCPRCSGGNGYIPFFKHAKGGVCFKCGGVGIAGNLAAKRASKLDNLYRRVACCTKLNRTNDVTTARRQLRELKEFVGKLPKRYFPA